MIKKGHGPGIDDLQHQLAIKGLLWIMIAEI